MPLSITATPMPLPLTLPSDLIAPDHAASAPVTSVVSAMCERTMALPDSASTSRSCDSASSPARDTVKTAPDSSVFLMRQAVTLGQAIDLLDRAR